MKRRPRIFWALNHSTLAKSECALLEKLGCEILTPKVCPKEILDCSGSIDYSFDHTLTIPAGDLARLNRCDFYAENIDGVAIELIRRHFDAVFVAAHFTMLETFCQEFDGLLILRAFGREQRKCYADFLRWRKKLARWPRWRNRILFRKGAWNRGNLLDKLTARGERFLFGGCYREVIDNEPSRVRDNSSFLPLGLPADTWSLAGSWTGGDDRVMFVCPRIHYPYYGQIYAEFQAGFGDLPSAVYGNQAENHGDSRLVGFLPRAEYDARMRRHAVMFYHSSEPCHLHYHPLEAVVTGMPLVYMAGGMLERMGGPDQPGLCRTREEARVKLCRIIAGDSELINSIRYAQTKLLDEFRDEFVESAWRQELLPRFKAAKRQAG
jgi:hypothetical protein